MGIFSKYLKNTNKNALEKGFYICKLENVYHLLKDDEDSIIFKFKGKPICINTGEITQDNEYIISCRFNFHGKSDSICEFLVKNIIKILSSLTNDDEKVMKMMDEVISLDDLCKKILNIKNYEEVIIELKEREFKDKKIIAVDYTDNFINNARTFIKNNLKEYKEETETYIEEIQLDETNETDEIPF